MDSDARQPERKLISVRLKVTPAGYYKGHKSVILDRREYNDKFGEISVSLIEPSRDNEERNQRVTNYLYCDRELPDIEPEYRGKYYTNETTERIGIGMALLSLGVSRAIMSPLKPPQPDMFVSTGEYRDFYVEYTMGVDKDNRWLQSNAQDLVDKVNALHKERKAEFLRGRQITIGFVKTPPKREHQFLVEILEKLIVSSEGKSGSYKVTDVEMQRYSPSFSVDVLKTGEIGSIEAAALPQYMATRDLFDVLCERLTEKRDIKKYDTSGKPLWLVVGANLPLDHLDVPLRLFKTNIELKYLSRIIIEADTQLVVFERNFFDCIGVTVAT